MHTAPDPAQPLHLSPGQHLPLQLSANSELFCQHGPVLLVIGPSGLAEQPQGYTMALQTGQSWRAPHRLCVQLKAAQGQTACIHLHTAQKHRSRPAPTEEQKRLGTEALSGLVAALARSWQALRHSLKRVRRAA